MTVVADEERFARLGQGVDSTGRLAEEAMDRVLDRLTACHEVASGFGAERIVVGATSASRDAANRHVLVERVRRELDLDYVIISGETEASLTFAGAVAMLPDFPPDAPALVIDVGGGSTEFVAGRAGSGPAARVSIDMGSVRLRERLLTELPAPAGDVRAARLAAAEAFAGVADEIARVRPVIGVAGTARVAAALARRHQGQPDGAAESGEIVSTPVLESWRDGVLGMSVRDALALDPALMAGREDVVGAGLLVMHAALERCGAEEFVYSVGGLRHGLLLAAAAGTL